MTKNQILKVLKAHLDVFDGVKYKYDGDHVIVSHEDPNDIWAAAEIECIVDVCRGLRLNYYLAEKGFEVYSSLYSAL